MNAAATLLRTAAMQITPDTWCQHRMRDGDRRCAVGHLRAVAGVGTDDADVAYAALIDAIERVSTHTCVSEWNDDHGRTADDVRALFLNAAAALDEARS